MPDITAATAAHERQHGSFLADAERRILVAIARRLPRFITADHLSATGFMGTVITAAAFVAASSHPPALAGVPLGLAINWFGDSLDGTVARVRNEQRPRYGYYLDHVLDIAGMAVLLAGMGASPYMSPAVAVLVFGAYVALMAESFLATHAIGVFRLSVWRVGPTELRVLLAIGALWLLRTPTVLVGGRSMLLFDVGGLCAVAGMVAAFVFSATRNAVALYRAEPLPRPAAAGSSTPESTRELSSNGRNRALRTSTHQAPR